MSEIQDHEHDSVAGAPATFEDGPKIFNTSEMVGDFIVTTQLAKNAIVIDEKPFWVRSVIALLEDGRANILLAVPSFNIGTGVQVQQALESVLRRAKALFEAPLLARVAELEKQAEDLRAYSEDAVKRLEVLKVEKKEAKKATPGASVRLRGSRNN